MRKIIIIVSAVLAMVACEKDNAFKSLPDGKKVFRASTMWKVNFDAAADDASMAYKIKTLCGN